MNEYARQRTFDFHLRLSKARFKHYFWHYSCINKREHFPVIMKTVETTFQIAYTEEQYRHAVEYVNDMKKHPKRVYWMGKEDKSDEELILSHIAHRVLSGFYNNYDPMFAYKNIISMKNYSDESKT